MPEEGAPPHTAPPTTTREIANRIAGLETLTKDLQRRVQDLERASGQPIPLAEQPGPPGSIREDNRRKEEAAPSGAQIPPSAAAGERQEPRRDVLSAPHSER
jgi:hypothetical protein